MDPGPSHPPTPIPNNPDQNPPPTPFTHCPHHLPDPPDPFPPPPRQNYGGLTSRLSKISFLAFDGTELRDWLSKCEQFFDIDDTPQELKIRLAAMHLRGKATEWHTNYMTTRFGLFPSWTDYIIAISARFCELFDDPLAELVALKQGSDSVVDYRDKFETAWMRLVLPEAHTLSIFLANMNPHLSLHTRQFEVTTISGAVKIAALHESSLSHAPTKPQRALFNPSPYQRSSKPPSSTPLLQNTDTSTTTKTGFIPRNASDKPPRKYSYQEMQDRRSKGLCMFCDETFTPGHQLKHKRSQIFVMECEDDDSSSESEQNDVVATPAPTDEQPKDTPVISINALDGSTSYNCMRMIGYYGKTKLHILVDPGSTHNFVDINIANHIGCKLESTKPMSVKAATGGTLITKYKFSAFTWSVQGSTFTTEFRTVPLDCYDFVLGVQWLCTLGPILWDFLSLRMEFTLLGTKHVLRGVVKTSGKVIKGSSLNKLLLQEPQIALIQIREVATEDTKDDNFTSELLFSHISATATTNADDPDLLYLLDSFSDIFEEPSSLPPFREGFDHQIPLLAGSNPVNLRPYRYSSLQKDNIDVMIKEMMTQGIIQHSSSPYASPIVLVKKRRYLETLCGLQRLKQADNKG
ncbi:uncharacterized protein LOC111203725 [Brassica napus]|uniref:uncharacterized protein LOC111203725 n=1 Tax=Brassica napus TaxID=3708 RepID=UPI000BBE7640|nr:uncharacterized protein LOC111203725 [Brassica napus]